MTMKAPKKKAATSPSTKKQSRTPDVKMDPVVDPRSGPLVVGLEGNPVKAKGQQYVDVVVSDKLTLRIFALLQRDEINKQQVLLSEQAAGVISQVLEHLFPVSN